MHRRLCDVLARANATMVEPDIDVTGALARLLADASEALPAEAAAVLVESNGTLEVLAATSHRVADLEVYQAEVHEGPCLDALHTGQQVALSGAEALVERWPIAGPVIVASGYTAVQATPLTWQGTTFGAFNVFRTEPAHPESLDQECRALADATSLILVSGRAAAADIQESLRSALADRAVVEQAKGALGHLRNLEMPEAFDALLRLADDEGVPLGVAARRVMERARAGTLGDPLRPSS